MTSELPPARLIVAMTAERLMGRANDLPWHLPEDLKHFKAHTKGGTCIMGRRSWESIGSKPLPKRTNVIVSRSVAGQATATAPVEREGGFWFASLPDACAWVANARPDGDGSPWILGGASLFQEVLAPLDDDPAHAALLGLPRPETFVVTWVPDVPLQDDDVLFPYDREWIEGHYQEVERRPGETAGLEFVTYRLPG